MQTYVVYDRESGLVLQTHVCPGAFELDEESIDDLVDSGNFQRAAVARLDAPLTGRYVSLVEERRVLALTELSPIADLG